MMMLLAPGLFRLDVRPLEDTLQVMTRSLSPGARWGSATADASDYGHKAEATQEPAVAGSRSLPSWRRIPSWRASRCAPPSTASGA